AEAVAAWSKARECPGANYKRAMAWIRPDGAPQFTRDRPGMGYESSWCGRGRSRWNGGGRHGIFTHAGRDSNHPKQHMPQKSIALMVELTQLITSAGTFILDPFMGSGTIAKAAIPAAESVTRYRWRWILHATAC
ncbi:MAG: DNA methyltransferase, partial [Telluria sp.]